MSDDYSDNILVYRRRKLLRSGSGLVPLGQHLIGADFFGVHLREMNEMFPYPVLLSRYTVPGRNDIYVFDWVPGGSGFGDRVRYFSDHGLPMDRALKMLQRDLDRKQVVELLVLACKEAGIGLCRPLVMNLLPIVAPRSAVLRACRKVFDKLRQDARLNSYYAKGKL